MKPKPVKERDSLDLLELVCELHSRSLNQPRNKNMHDAYIEAKQEMERRIKALHISNSLLPEKEEIQAAYKKVSEDNIKYNLSYDNENWFEAGVHFCSNYNCSKSNLKEFEVKRLTNGKDESHLVIITKPAIEDIFIGTVLIVPYVDGFKDPKSVILQIDADGKPKIANDKFVIVNEYVYE
jgi:hypothetical protein